MIDLDCIACPLHETRNKVVAGEGPVPAPVMLIAEGPGKNEDREGRPFVVTARAGEELTHILNRQIRLPRENVYITNTVKCRVPHDKDPKPDCVRTCTNLWLHKEIEAVRPNVIGTVGRISTRHFLGDVSMERVHGIPFKVSVLGEECIIVPIFHPASGLRDPIQMLKCHADFRALAEVLFSERPAQHLKDRYPVPNYVTLNDPWSIEVYLVNSKVVAVDTEWAEGKPWCITLSVRPGEAIRVMADNKPALLAIQNHLLDSSVLTLIHNALYDLPVLSEMGIFPATVADTMVMAYLLQSEPQGLKDLSFRHAGMEMSDYKEMVQAATNDKAFDYLDKVADREWPKQEVLVWDKGQPRIKKPQPLHKKAQKIITDTLVKDADPGKRWKNIPQAEREQAEEVFGHMEEGYLSDIDDSDAEFYACRDADATIRVYPHLWSQIQAKGLEDTFWTDMAALPMVVDMMKNGIKIDPAHFVDLSEYFQACMYELETEIEQKGGQSIDVGSPKQISELLFNKHKLPRIKGDSTGDKILAAIKGKHPVVQPIRDWREYAKLKTTYSDKMPQLAGADHRIHATFRITRVPTGRLSTSNPNLMAQPVRTEEARKIRKGFIAEKGYVFVSGDYSQLELRILAHISKAVAMLAAFKGGKDFHEITGRNMFGLHDLSIPLDPKKERYPAKRVNYGIIYGISAFGLHEQFVKEGITAFTVEDCEEFIRLWLDAYPEVRKYISDTLAHCRRYGFVRTLYGRIRYIPAIRSPNKWVRAEAERMALNAPIQGTAADIMKKAMGNLVPVYRELAQYSDVRPLLQVHDDLIWEVPEKDVDWIIPMLSYELENAVELDVPTPADPKIGYVWGEMDDYVL